MGYIAKKGTDPQLRARGIESFRRDIAQLVPRLADWVDELESMNDVKHLDVRVNRLARWHVDGPLCIGDAAHAMSPMGGVGINLAVQDAVAAATLLAEPLRPPGAAPGPPAGAPARWICRARPGGIGWPSTAVTGCFSSGTSLPPPGCGPKC